MKPRLLDAFSGAGGCGRGYQLAGFYVVGVDIEPQPRYAGDEFVQGDALEFIREHGHEFDAIHASPPCQDYSKAMRHLSAPQPRLIGPVRELLEASGLPWVLENVEGAPLPHSPTLDGRYGVMICGSALGLRVWRHRLFETSFYVPAPGGCDHRKPPMNPHNQPGRDRITEEFGPDDRERPWREAMGVAWMRRYEAREAIPPAMTEYVGGFLLDALERKAAA